MTEKELLVSLLSWNNIKGSLALSLLSAVFPFLVFSRPVGLYTVIAGYHSVKLYLHFLIRQEKKEETHLESSKGGRSNIPSKKKKVYTRRERGRRIFIELLVRRKNKKRDINMLRKISIDTKAFTTRAQRRKRSTTLDHR